MAEGRVKYSSLAVILVPRDRKIFVLPMQAARLAVIELGRVQTCKHVHFFTRIWRFHHVNFVANRERRRKFSHGWKLSILHNYGCVKNSPRVIVEIASDHFTESRPSEVRISGRVRPYEPFAVVMHESEQISFLLLGKIAFAGSQEKDRVEVVQILCVDVSAGVRRTQIVPLDPSLGQELRIGS